MKPDPDADPDPSIFIIDLQDANKKLILKKKFSCILNFEGTFTSFFKDKKSKRSQIVEIKVFFYYIGLMIRIQEAQKHVDPVDPDSDPQHCHQLTGSVLEILRMRAERR
jgi:hypothetical protein